jgi:hypothetical protein
MSDNLGDLFAAAKRAGFGVLVINNLEIHNGDNITADYVAGGDINASRNATLTNPRPSEAHRLLHGVEALDDSDPWAWRYADLQRSAAQHQKDYAEECEVLWQKADEARR